VKAVCTALGVARSHVCVMLVRPDDWVDDRTVQTFHRPCDVMLVDAVRTKIATLPTYGYRRAGALVNRTRTLLGLQTVNHRRFYRVMKANSLLLPKAPKRPVSSRVHDGVVWRAWAERGLPGEPVRDMLVEAVQARFGRPTLGRGGSSS
jgi:putative transposase